MMYKYYVAPPAVPGKLWAGDLYKNNQLVFMWEGTWTGGFMRDNPDVAALTETAFINSLAPDGKQAVKFDSHIFSVPTGVDDKGKAASLRHGEVPGRERRLLGDLRPGACAQVGAGAARSAGDPVGRHGRQAVQRHRPHGHRPASPSSRSRPRRKPRLATRSPARTPTWPRPSRTATQRFRRSWIVRNLDQLVRRSVLSGS